jgi:hypothetical protein
MCGRNASRLPPEYIWGLFRTVGGVPNFAPNYNLSPSQGAMVVRWQRCGARASRICSRQPASMRQQ